MANEPLFIVHKAGRGWYRANAQGYTTSITEAGRYTRDEAEAHAFPNGRNGPRDGMSFQLEPEPSLAAQTDADLLAQARREGIAEGLEMAAKVAEREIAELKELGMTHEAMGAVIVKKAIRALKDGGSDATR